MKYKTRKNEERLISLFSERRPFSEHLAKWEDKLLPDKYDQNFFEYSGQPTKEEFAKAVQYQKELGAGFIKLEGNAPLADSFGIEAGVTLTMTLKSDGAGWKTNPSLSFRTPPIKELEKLDVSYSGPLYGEDFSRRNIRRLYEKLTFHGAYLDEYLVGACYSFSSDGLTCIDGLIVDEAHRKKYIATSLIAHIKRSFPGTVLFLHADEDDTPKEMYKKMGFEITDRLYEYLCTDIGKMARPSDDRFAEI
ncbi:MAG: GNAT family N-acetyltransferase [Oscillospiraceae bacterium]|nr:GNAT family N-acetyltransferase [Oscillospiraceae bacterium]